MGSKIFDLNLLTLTLSFFFFFKYIFLKCLQNVLNDATLGLLGKY